MEICAEMFMLDKDKDLFTFFVSHYAVWFSALRELSGIVCQAASLWLIKTLIQKRIVKEHGAHLDAVHAIGTVPLPFVFTP